MKPVLVRPAAAADIEDAYSWYETQRPGLGDEFREALRYALNLVGANPKIHQVIHRDTRRVLLKRFPYGVYSGFVSTRTVCLELSISEASFGVRCSSR